MISTGTFFASRTVRVSPLATAASSAARFQRVASPSSSSASSNGRSVRMQPELKVRMFSSNSALLGVSCR